MRLTDDWIIGFFEGERSFHHVKSRSNIYLTFSVSQKEYRLLVRIKKYFGLGGISHMDQPTGRIWNWVASNRHDLKLIVAFLDGRTRSDKRIREYEKWKHRFHSYFEHE